MSYINQIIMCFLVLSLSSLTLVQANLPSADLTDDCMVDIADLVSFTSQWLDSPGDSANLDGVPGVTLEDYAILSAQWQMGCPPITLVINEFMADNKDFYFDEAGDSDDWLEIYNFGAVPIDMGGMYITDSFSDPAPYQIPTGMPELTTVQAGGFLIIWADGEPAEGPLHATFKLAAGGGEDLALFDSRGQEVDSLLDFAPQAENDSYGRMPDAGDQWQFFVHDSPTPATPGYFNGGQLPGDDILITEIMYHPYNSDHPLSEDIGEEYIEIYNDGFSAVNLEGWQITDGVSYTFGNVSIGPKEYLVIASDTVKFSAKYPEVTNVIGGWEGRLSNSGEDVELTAASGKVINQITYTDQGEWSSRELGPLDYTHRGWQWNKAHDGDGKSLELTNVKLDNEYGNNWAASLTDNGTPGKENSTLTNTFLPIITEVKHEPVIPHSSEQVNVSVQIYNNNASPATAKLAWRIDQSVYLVNIYPTYNESSYTFIDMTDNGNGLFTAAIPPQPDGAIVEFFITATNNNGSRTYPAACDIDGSKEQVSNLLYQVDDTFDLANTWTPGDQPIYRIIMTQGEKDHLSDIGSDVYSDEEYKSNAEMNATFISIDGTGMNLRYNTGVRNRGNGSRRNPPMNFHVNFVHDKPWKDMIALNLNSKYTHLQVLGSAVFRLAGVPSSEAKAVQLRVNGENLATTDTARTYGSYAALESFNGDYLEKHIPDDSSGNFYRCSYSDQNNPRTYADLTYHGEDPADYIDNYTKKTNEEEDDWTDLFALTYTLNNYELSNEDFITEVSKVVNIKQWARYLATDTLIGNREGGLYSGTGDDYALYRGVNDSRFILVSHDLDTLFGQGSSSYSSSVSSSIFGFGNVTGLQRLFNHPDFMFLYYQQLHELSTTVLAPENIYPVIDEILTDWVPDSLINGSSGIKAFLNDRADNVLYGTDPQVPDLSLTVSGSNYTTTGSYSLSGNFGCDTTRSITLNGTPVIDANWDQKDGTWSHISGTTYTELIIPRHSYWKYLDDGSDQKVISDGISWYGHPQFDDSGFKPESQAKFGYGDNNENTTVSYGPSSSNKYTTTYFRKTFEVEDASKFSQLKVLLNRDDGAAVFLNGTRILLHKLPEDFTYATFAQSPAVGGDDEDTFFEEDVDSSLLITGTNVIAAEIHQISLTSSDVAFDLELIGYVAVSDNTADLEPGMNRVNIKAFDGPNGTGNEVDSKYIDIFNDNGYTTDVSGTLIGDLDDVGTVHALVRDSYIPSVPVLVRVELRDQDNNIKRDIWDMQATLSVDNPNVSLDVNNVKLYNGMGSVLVTFTGSGDFNLTVDVLGNQFVKTLTDLQNEPVNIITSPITTNETWNGIYRITGSDFSIPDGLNLTIEPGSLIMIDGVSSGTSGLDINIYGSLMSLGTDNAPITFTAFSSGNNWGEFDFQDAESSAFLYTNITQAGHSPGVGHSGSGPVVRCSGSTIAFNYTNITDNAGKIGNITNGSELIFHDCLWARSWMGCEISSTSLDLARSWIVDMHGVDDADGIYIHSQNAGQQCILSGGVAASIDDDGIDTLGSNVTIEDFIVRDCKDKGISFYNGHSQVTQCLVVNNNSLPEDPTVASIAAKATSGSTTIVDIDRTTVVSTKTEGVVDFGIQSHNKQSETDGAIIWNITNSIIDATDPIDVEAPYLESDVNVSYTCLYSENWPGVGNINIDPLLVDINNNIYYLTLTSQCIDAGDPSLLDLDGTRLDMGYFPYQDIAINRKDTLVWSSFNSPYRVTSDIIVPAGLTLEIEPGVSVLFDDGTQMIVNGRLLAQGTEQDEIFFTKHPSSSGTWGGIQFVDTMQANLISYAIIDESRSSEGMVGLVNSDLTLENSWLGYTGTDSSTPLRHIEFLNSSLIIRDCVFDDICRSGEAPTNNSSEHIWGQGVPEGGNLIIENNIFGTTPGHNDAIDIDSILPQTPIPHILNNTFLGGGDDALDLETDAYIEGNLFKNYIKDAYNTDPQESNIVSAGRGQTYTIVRNTFMNCQHAVQVKDDAFLYFINNTVANASADAIYFGAAPAAPGKGVYIDSSIFYNTNAVLPEVIAPSTAEVHSSIVPTVLHALGNDNIEATPVFADPEIGDFSLIPGSPGIGAGQQGIDMGSFVPGGIIFITSPLSQTHQSNATFTLCGPGMSHYAYRLDGGPWSSERSIDEAITLTGLTDISHTLEVVGKTSANLWQTSSQAAVWNWTVDSSQVRVLINEVCADSYDSDWIELYNASNITVNLAGMSITDNQDNPDKYVFDSTAIINPGDYLLLYADNNNIEGEISLGFNLNASGEEVLLYDTGGNLLDSISFGSQIPDSTIGRVGPDQSWALNYPSPGSNNIARLTGNIYNLSINEWLADAAQSGDDFIELYNADSKPVNMSGLFITDNPLNQQMKHEFANLSFINGFGLMLLTADNSNDPGHLNFRLDADEEFIALFDASLGIIDKILYLPQTTGVSQGANPENSGQYTFFHIPTPGLLNNKTIVINEVLAHSHAEAADWIELFNSSNHIIDISGWYLSDDPADLKKFEIPASTILQPGDYAVFYEDIHFGKLAISTGFGLSEGGETLYLYSALNGEFSGYRTKEDFGASQTDVSFGRHQNSTGDYNFVAMSSKTEGYDNSSPLTDPVVISEIMYNPTDNTLEYLELVNITASNADLFSTVSTQYGPDPSQVTKEVVTWRITNGIDFTFPNNTTLSAGERILLVKDIAAFIASYTAIPSGTRIFQWQSGSLSNDGETIQLSMPGDQEWNRDRFWINVDKVKYDDYQPWPTQPDSGNTSLNRISEDSYGNDPANWNSLPPNPGQ